MHSFRRLTASAALPLVLLLTACGGGADPSEILTTDADVEDCEDLLSGDAMTELTGEQGSYRLDEESGLATCQALISGEVGARVTVVRAPATDWPEAARPTLTKAAQQESTGDDQRDQEFRDLVEQSVGGSVSADEACTMFSYLAETIHDADEGTNYAVATYPKGGLEVLSGQSCAGGIYTAVLIESMGSVDDSQPTRDLLRAAVAELNPGEEIS